MITWMSGGRVGFQLHAGRAKRVELLGSFTGWERSPIAMTERPCGWFTTRCVIEPGDHEFQYLIDGREWLADYGASGVRLNDFGLWVSQLHVPEPAVRKLVVETRPIKAKLTPAPGGRVSVRAA